ncbi:MAG: PKD domain-containing protein, partial [Thermoplasmata archaeon]|nr:PKD domain-containing protein [Thermoplasmata archaeon]
MAFGGGIAPYGQIYTFSNATWIYNGSGHLLTTHPTPPARANAGLVWDPVDGYMVLFGGMANDINLVPTQLNDTWSYRAGNWTKLAPTISPPARYDFGFVWDPSLQLAVLYGGGLSSGATAAGTWTFVGGQWTSVTVTSYPPSVQGERLAMDPSTGDALLLGAPARNHSIAPWTYSASGWGRQTTTQVPPDLIESAATVDPRLGGLVVFGGCRTALWGANQGPGYATWLFAQGAWRNLTPTSSPGVSCDATLTYYDPTGSLLLTGGDANLGSNSATLVYALLAPNVTASIGPDHGYAPLTVSFSANATGGVGPYRYNWSLGNGLAINASTGKYTYSQPGDYFPYVTATDTYGAVASAWGEVQVFAPLNVSAVVSPLSGSVPLTVDASAASVGGAPPVMFAWTFSGGAVIHAAATEFTFTYPGIFSVQLSASDAGGEITDAIWTIIATSAFVQPPTIVVTASPDRGPAPLHVAFQTAASGGVPPYQYAWTFGDGSTSSSTRYTRLPLRVPSRWRCCSLTLRALEPRGRGPCRRSGPLRSPRTGPSRPARRRSRWHLPVPHTGEPQGTPSSGPSATG